MNATLKVIHHWNVFAVPTIRCACCRTMLHPEDFRPDKYPEAFTAPLHDRYGPNVCAGCMDNIDKEGMPI